MQKQNGFTLVELVVVIIILGILAVTAAPKFINMQHDARVSTLQGVKGAINGANVMVYAKASLQGISKTSGAVDIGQGTDGDKGLNTVLGYVAATKKDITKAADLQGNDWHVYDSSNAPTADSNLAGTEIGKDTVLIQQQNAPKDCYLVYGQAKANELPTLTATTSGC